MKILFKRLNPSAVVPVYQTPGSAAADVSACLDKSISIGPGERIAIPTGIAFQIPVGYEIQVRARSGLSLKHGICLANGVGTIDSDYRGELSVILVNLSDVPFVVTPGMRVAQIVLARYEHFKFEAVESLDETKRGKAGFGSTGI